MLLGTVTMQPGEVRDVDVHYSKWLPSGDVVDSSVVADPGSGLSVSTPVVINSGKSIKLWTTALAAGTYKVEFTTTTALGRVKQDELKFRVKDF